MVAENPQPCIVCALDGRQVLVVWHLGVPLHYQGGKLDRVLFSPYPHEATTDPQPDDR